MTNLALELAIIKAGSLLITNKVRELLNIAKLNLQTIIIDGSKTGNLQKVWSNQDFVSTLVSQGKRI